jgi:signal transduction histidine kinase/CheY-like chemotaxis protein
MLDRHEPARLSHVELIHSRKFTTLSSSPHGVAIMSDWLMQAARRFFHRQPDAGYAAQLRSSIEHLPLTLIVSVVNSILLGFVLAPVTSSAILMCWIALVVLLSLLRFGLWYAHRRIELGMRVWATLATTGALLSGFLWGCTPLLFAPMDEAHLLFLALVLAGMSAGAATVHAAHVPSAIAFIVPAIVPLARTFFVLGGRLQIVSGLMTVIFGISLCVASIKFNSWFRKTTEAELILAARTQELDAANKRLVAEISSHRATEAQFRQSQKLETIGRLTAGIAHDFNNLLMAIGGSANLIAMRAGAENVYAAYLGIIAQSIERGTALTRRLLAFGRQQTLLPRSVEVNEVISGLKDLLTTPLTGNVRLDLQLGQTQITAFVDVNQLEQAILNLVINARDAMPAGGVVTIRTASVDLSGHEAGTEGLIGRFALISVADTGTGMPEHVRVRAFDPFFTTKGVGKGSGLGLSQVYGLVKQSGGETRIDTEPEKGTTIHMYLPQGQRDTAPVFRPVPSEPAAHPELEPVSSQIILVDDDEDVRHTLAAMLDAAGYAVESYGNPLQALEQLRTSRLIDLLVVDFAMAELRGDQLAAEARQLRGQIPVVFVTGYADTDSLRSEPWVLQKPFRAQALIQIVEHALSDAKALPSET